jgi:hypothetical protein
MHASQREAHLAGVRVSATIREKGMCELLTYRHDELPKKWFYQIISFQRICWADDFRGGLEFRNYIVRPKYRPFHILIATDDILISHAMVLSATVDHCGRAYKFYGVSAVMTYPVFQGQGYGSRVTQAATGHVLARPDADVGIVVCEDFNVGFYQRFGWEFVDNTLLVGDAEAPEASELRFALRYLSERAKTHRADLETVPIFLGDEW